MDHRSKACFLQVIAARNACRYVPKNDRSFMPGRSDWTRRKMMVHEDTSEIPRMNISPGLFAQ
jgi:hypothetical protein